MIGKIGGQLRLLPPKKRELKRAHSLKSLLRQLAVHAPHSRADAQHTSTAAAHMAARQILLLLHPLYRRTSTGDSLHLMPSVSCIHRLVAVEDLSYERAIIPQLADPACGQPHHMGDMGQAGQCEAAAAQRHHPLKSTSDTAGHSWRHCRAYMASASQMASLHPSCTSTQTTSQYTPALQLTHRQAA